MASEFVMPADAGIQVAAWSGIRPYRVPYRSGDRQNVGCDPRSHR